MSFQIQRPERVYASDLERAIFETPLCDTHEHLRYESVWNSEKADVLSDLLSNYVTADLKSAGATDEATQRALDAKDPDIEKRLSGVLPALERCRHTGYGEAVFLSARDVYGIEKLTPAALTAAQPILDNLKQPGGRLHLLREVARLDHTQTDDFVWPCLPDPSGRSFFFYDLSWVNFAKGDIAPLKVHEDTGVEVRDVTSLEEAMRKIFVNYAPCAIAVKSQHAYARTLEWRERDRSDVEIALNKRLSHPETPLPEEDLLCLGDWCLAKGVELSIEFGLPFKIHTGYYAGNGYMIVNRVPAGHLCSLLAKYPKARFVLMHIAYPYQDEIVALAKHFPNVVVDLCWAWSIDPFSSKDVVRRMLHAAPVNRLFGFGGDTWYATTSYAYSIQARTWLARALAEEVADKCLSESEAIAVARAWMLENQLETFNLAGKREAVQAWQGPLLDK
jgi:predicted TIM-barrel fold metal-dependent hydrolase